MGFLETPTWGQGPLRLGFPVPRGPGEWWLLVGGDLAAVECLPAALRGGRWLQAGPGGSFLTAAPQAC